MPTDRKPPMDCGRPPPLGALDRAGAHRPQDPRPGEIAVAPPENYDAGLYFIGFIHTPWRDPKDCPRQGAFDGPACEITLDPRWRRALEGVEVGQTMQVLYFMHRARRDLVIQAPHRRPQPIGTFAIRSPARPNPIASSLALVENIQGMVILARGLDCLDGTPLIDLKPHHRPASDFSPAL